MIVSLVVAMSENGVIGRDGGMPWHLSADLRRFKRLTMGHHLVMGRRTFESIGRLLPGRTTVIMTRQSGYRVPGAVVCDSLSAALDVASADSEVFVVGGGEIYRLALPLAGKLYVTRVHATIDDGDTYFPDVDWSHWRRTESQSGQSDDANQFDYTFEIYERTTPTTANRTDAATAG